MGKTISPEIRAYIVEAGAGTLDWCMQCGLCSSICPWRLVPGRISERFFARRMMRLAQLGLEGFDEEDLLFACTTCGMCQVNCPRQVRIIDNLRSMRRAIAEGGLVPAFLRTMVGSLHANGNPWSGPRERRTDWQDDLRVPVFSAEMDYFLFVCCTSCYDARSRRIARSVVCLLQHAGVRFGVIGAEESCCGESARKTGLEDLFEKLARSNIDLFRARGVRKIITTSPHCLYTFRHEYPALGGEFEVLHYTELLVRLVEEGRLVLRRPIEARVAYHDPCYLGRHNGVFAPPRRLIEAIPDIEFVELDRAGENSLCCGGGGGRLWAEVPKGERFGEIRVREAVARGANVLVTACPYCVMMLEADALSLGMEGLVMELSELLSRAV